MMNDLITDWVDFCEGKKPFDKSHFYTLFQEDIDEDGLRTIFKYFPNADQLFEITRDYLFGSDDLSHLKKGDPKETLLQLAIKDVQQKKTLLPANHPFLKLTENLQAEYIQDINLVEKKKAEKPYSALFSDLEFEITEKWLIEDKKAFALYEAFYGLVTTYEIVWYLFSPLIKTDVDFKVYVDFTRMGGAYSFDEGKLIVSSWPR